MFFPFFSTGDATQRVVYFFRTVAYNATRRILFVSHTFPFSPDAGILGKGGVLVASAYICVCPQLTWPAPPSTAVDILLYLDLPTIRVLCVYHIIILSILINFNSVVNEYLLSLHIAHVN
jgi:hypothetical protein